MLNKFSSNGTWRDQLQELVKTRNEYSQYANVMTAFERLNIEKAIKGMRAEIEPVILAGARAEWDTAIQNFKAKDARVKAARSKESARWDAARLNSEMQAVEMMVKQTVKSNVSGPLDNATMARINAIYEDFQNSGDIYKQRAAGEVYAGLVSMVGEGFDQRQQAYVMAERAQRDILKAREFDELKAAEQEAIQAVEGLNQAKMLLHDVDRDLGDTRPNGTIGNYELAQELARVRTDEDGNITQILDRSDIHGVL